MSETSLIPYGESSETFHFQKKHDQAQDGQRFMVIPYILDGCYTFLKEHVLMCDYETLPKHSQG